MAPARDVRTEPSASELASSGLRQAQLYVICLSDRDRLTPNANGGAPSGGTPPLRIVRAYAEADSSPKKPRVLFGSTGMPGAMVVVKVIFLR